LVRRLNDHEFLGRLSVARPVPRKMCEFCLVLDPK
jgi:hypothetical protein